jgi:undecaprenyl-diphosphatase
MNSLIAFDVWAFRAINNLAGLSVSWDAVFIFGAKYLIFLMPLVVVAYVFAAWRTSHFEGRVENFWHVGWTVVIAFIIEKVIGYLWFRARPFRTFHDVHKLIAMSPLDKSFPSGHASIAFAMAFGLMLHNRKWGWLMVALAAWVAFSRVWVGVHYPLDVIGGLAVGALSAWITAPAKKAIEPYLDLFKFFRRYRRNPSA